MGPDLFIRGHVWRGYGINASCSQDGSPGFDEVNTRTPSIARSIITISCPAGMTALSAASRDTAFHSFNPQAASSPVSNSSGLFPIGADFGCGRSRDAFMRGFVFLSRELHRPDFASRSAWCDRKRWFDFRVLDCGRPRFGGEVGRCCNFPCRRREYITIPPVVTW